MNELMDCTNCKANMVLSHAVCVLDRAAPSRRKAATEALTSRGWKPSMCDYQVKGARCAGAILSGHEKLGECEGCIWGRGCEGHWPGESSLCGHLSTRLGQGGCVARLWHSGGSPVGTRERFLSVPFFVIFTKR